MMRWYFYSLLAIIATVAFAAWVGKPHPLEIKPPVKVERPEQDLDFERIRTSLERLTATPSRMTGYPGAEQAYQYIMSELKAAGLNDVQVQDFSVAVPLVRQAALKVVTPDGSGQTMAIHPLWPNMARTTQTPAEGISGPLVDVGKGLDANLAGKRIRDSIVVVDWDSNVEWLSAPEFGGKAVLFRANENGGYNATRNKFLTVPANIPRFYVAKEDLPTLDRLLAQPGVTVNLTCEMAWERVTSHNIFVKINAGDTPRTAEERIDNAPVIFHAYYDSISAVPDLAPGAEQACGAATLLEVGRFLAKVSPKPHRPVYLLFSGAHGQCLTGMTHFVRTLLDGQENGWGDQRDTLIARMGQPGVFIGLDLSSRSDRLGVFCVGSFRDQGESLLRPKFRSLGLKLDQYAKSFATSAAAKAGLPVFTDCINLLLGRGWWTYFPYRAAFESEIPNMAGLPGVTLSTINDDRRHVDTPDDRFSDLSFDQFRRQIMHAAGERIGLANLVLALSFWKGPFNNSEMENHLARISGRVVWLDQQKDYTPNQPLVDAPVFLKSLRAEKYILGTRGNPVVFTDKNGRFAIDGLIESSQSPAYLNCTLEAYGMATKSFVTANPNAIGQYIKDRQKLDPNFKNMPLDGSVIYAMDMARPDEYPFKTDMMKRDVYLNLVCFPCKTITLYGLTEPRGYLGLREIQMLDASTQSPPFQYGKSSSDTVIGNSDENCITIWASPNIRLRMTLGFGLQEKRLVLVNNTVDDPIGQAFIMDQLENIPSMVLRGAQDMWNLDQFRMTQFQKYGITNPRVRDIHAEADGYIQKARTALEKYDYTGYRSSSEKGWALESKAYSELLSMTNDMIRGVLFYLALLLPFAYCIERLVFASGTIRNRILLMLGIFIGSFLILALIHPAFRFTLTPLIVLLAFVILVLAVTVSLLVAGKFDAMLQERKAALTGQHEDAQNVGNIAVRAVDLGIANIRRRPQRGFLTGMTIVLVTFTLLSFTSLVPEVSVSKLKHPTGNPVYNGLLARDRGWNGMPGPLYDSIQRTFEQDKLNLAGGLGKQSIVAARVWYFSDLLGNLSQIDLVNATKSPATAAGPTTGTTASAAPVAASVATTSTEGLHFTSVALVGMEPTEPAVSGIDRTLIAGRWFRERLENGIILPNHIAKQLGITPQNFATQTVFVFGLQMPVLGIYDEKKMDAWKDIDGEPLTPVNFALQALTKAQKETTQDKPDTLEDYIHYTSDQIAIVPLKFAIKIGATYRSIAIRTGEGVNPNAEAEGYARRSNLSILASDGTSVLLYSMMDRNKLNAAGQIFIPVMLGFMMVLGTMLGSVYERRREIFIYNSVGLAPSNVASLFLAESSVYAVIGACMGYLLGQVVSKVLMHTHWLSSMGLNYSAGTTVFVTLLTMGIVVLSTLYPMRQAFRAAIPDTHKDVGDEEVNLTTGSLSIYLPFVATPSSVFAMQSYMYEYLDGLQGVTIGQLAIDNLAAAVEEQEGRSIPVLTFRAWLAPFDLGISHDTQLRIVYRADRGIYQYHLTAHHYSGDQQNWRRLTPRFILSIRKQLLMWRILSGEAQANYSEKALALFGQSQPNENGKA